MEINVIIVRNKEFSYLQVTSSSRGTYRFPQSCFFSEYGSFQQSVLLHILC